MISPRMTILLCFLVGGDGVIFCRSRKALENSIEIHSVHDEEKRNDNLALLFYIYDISRQTGEQVEKGGSDESRKHGWGKPLVFDGVQSFVEWQEDSSATGNRTTENRTKDWDGKIASGNGSGGSKSKLAHDESTHSLVEKNDGSLERCGREKK